MRDSICYNRQARFTATTPSHPLGPTHPKPRFHACRNSKHARATRRYRGVTGRRSSTHQMVQRRTLPTHHRHFTRVGRACAPAQPNSRITTKRTAAAGAAAFGSLLDCEAGSDSRDPFWQCMQYTPGHHGWVARWTSAPLTPAPPSSPIMHVAGAVSPPLARALAHVLSVLPLPLSFFLSASLAPPLSLHTALAGVVRAS